MLNRSTSVVIQKSGFVEYRDPEYSSVEDYYEINNEKKYDVYHITDSLESLGLIECNTYSWHPTAFLRKKKVLTTLTTYGKEFVSRLQKVINKK